MTMQLYRTASASGGFDHGPWEDVQGELPSTAIPIPRYPEPFEDWIDGAWVVADPQALANWSAGPEHISTARAQKRIEALMVKQGLVLTHGLLAAEAEARGITIKNLAEIVLEKTAHFHATELERQKVSL